MSPIYKKVHSFKKDDKEMVIYCELKKNDQGDFTMMGTPNDEDTLGQIWKELMWIRKQGKYSRNSTEPNANYNFIVAVYKGAEIYEIWGIPPGQINPKYRDANHCRNYLFPILFDIPYNSEYLNIDFVKKIERFRPSGAKRQQNR